MLPWFCATKKLQKKRQNEVVTSVTHSAAPRMPGSLFLSHFDVTCDQSLDKCMEEWILFVD